MTSSISLSPKDLYVVFEEDGYGIGQIRGNQVYLSKESAESIHKPDEISSITTLDEALNTIHDNYWAHIHKNSRRVSPEVFRTDRFRDPDYMRRAYNIQFHA